MRDVAAGAEVKACAGPADLQRGLQRRPGGVEDVAGVDGFLRGGFGRSGSWWWRLLKSYHPTNIGPATSWA